MESGSELSKTVATFILQKILLDELGLDYICQTYERFAHVATILGKMVMHLAKEPSQRLLKHVVRCYLRLADNPRWVDLFETARHHGAVSIIVFFFLIPQGLRGASLMPPGWATRQHLRSHHPGRHQHEAMAGATSADLGASSVTFSWYHDEDERFGPPMTPSISDSSACVEGARCEFLLMFFWISFTPPVCSLSGRKGAVTGSSMNLKNIVRIKTTCYFDMNDHKRTCVHSSARFFLFIISEPRRRFCEFVCKACN